jgi:hypothetical protein
VVFSARKLFAFPTVRLLGRMAQGIAELKLKQRLLKEQMSLLDEKTKRCNDLLLQRKASKLKLKPQESHDNQRLISKRSLLRDVASSHFKEAPPPSLPVPVVASGQMAELRKKHLTRSLEEHQRVSEENLRRPNPGPGKAGAFKPNSLPETMFPIRHARNELPCSIEHVSFGEPL